MTALLEPRAVRLGPASLRTRPLGVIGVALAVLAILLLMAAGLTLGEIAITPARVWATLWGYGDRLENLVVLDLRLPRILSALLVGVALGVSGAISQTMTRNPLASPDVLGVTAGAGLGAVSVISLVGRDTPTGPNTWLLPAGALAGGLLTALVVYSMAWRAGPSDNRIILVGIGMSALAAALTNWLLIRTRVEDAQRAAVWLSGSLNNRTWGHVLILAATIPTLLLVLAPLSRQLGALALGDQIAAGLGVPVNRSRLGLTLSLVFLASIATAAVGPLAFLAMSAPQIAVRLVAAATPPLLLSGLVGAAVLLAADLAARLLFPVELPVGLLTAAVGAIFLGYLLLSKRGAVA
ncbi:MAG: FecCD family ABC transporter permease [Candidatus Nanopelagicales bacterium]